MNTEIVFRRLAITLAIVVSLTFSLAARAGGSSEYKATAPQPMVEPVSPSCTGLFEVSVGYNYMHLDQAEFEQENLHGVDASAFFNVTSCLGLGADFMANFGGRTVSGVDVDSQRYVYVFGPRLSFCPTKNLRVFIEALAGGVHAEADVSSGGFNGNASADGFAGAAGGGVDWHLNDHWSLRLIQADYLPTSLSGDWQHNFRASTGIVYRFGSRR